MESAPRSTADPRPQAARTAIPRARRAWRRARSCRSPWSARRQRRMRPHAGPRAAPRRCPCRSTRRSTLSPAPSIILAAAAAALAARTLVFVTARTARGLGLARLFQYAHAAQGGVRRALTRFPGARDRAPLGRMQRLAGEPEAAADRLDQR